MIRHSINKGFIWEAYSVSTFSLSLCFLSWRDLRFLFKHLLGQILEDTNQNQEFRDTTKRCRKEIVYRSEFCEKSNPFPSFHTAYIYLGLLKWCLSETHRSRPLEGIQDALSLGLLTEQCQLERSMPKKLQVLSKHWFKLIESFRQKIIQTSKSVYFSPHTNICTTESPLI